MLKKILMVVVVVIVVFFGLAAMQPAEFSISRSASIAAAPAKVFAQVNDFHRWENWSPWAKIDPTMTAHYDGAASGEGSSYAWSGKGKAGEGKMTLLKSQAPDLIQIKLEFIRPMKATNMIDFSFKPEGQGTMVTWAMSGKNNLISKAFSMVCNMDKLVGGDFEKGLAQLKVAAESAKD